MMENRPTMLTITTLFLGLVVGPQPVEIAADAAVARIVLTVDGAPCASLAAPPWSARCDFGPTPAPRRLVATGYDGDGREVARAERVANLFRAAAEVDVHLERTSSGGMRARLVADSLAGGPPRSARVELDGAEIPAADLGAIELPAVDLEIPHLLRAELEWSDTVSAVGETVFGGRHGETISSELTAVAVESERRAAIADVQGALAGPGGAVRVVALDEGAADLFVVLDPEAIGPLAKVSSITARVPVGGATLSTPGGGDRQTRGLAGANQRFVYTLERDDRVRIVWPWPERRESGGRTIVAFPPSPPFTSRDGGLAWILVRARLPAGRQEAPSLVDAAAVAGMIVEGRERRRAVLVVLGEASGGGAADVSRLHPAALRAYLGAVHVPLFVWRTGRWQGEGPDPWGDVVVLGSSLKFQSAFRALADSLARQRIAWIEGSWLPNELRLTAAPTDLRWAGGTPR